MKLNTNNTNQQNDEIVSECKKIALVGDAVDALIRATVKNRFDLHEMNDIVLGMAERKMRKVLKAGEEESTEGRGFE